MSMYTIEEYLKAAEEFNRKLAEERGRALIKACEENDFIVPNKEIKRRLEEILPEGAKIVVSPYTDGIYMVKRLDYSTLFDIGEIK